MLGNITFNLKISKYYDVIKIILNDINCNSNRLSKVTSLNRVDEIKFIDHFMEFLLDPRLKVHAFKRIASSIDTIKVDNDILNIFKKYILNVETVSYTYTKSVKFYFFHQKLVNLKSEEDMLMNFYVDIFNRTDFLLISHLTENSENFVKDMITKFSNIFFKYKNNYKIEEKIKNNRIFTILGLISYNNSYIYKQSFLNKSYLHKFQMLCLVGTKEEIESYFKDYLKDRIFTEKMIENYKCLYNLIKKYNKSLNYKYDLKNVLTREHIKILEGMIEDLYIFSILEKFLFIKPNILTKEEYCYGSFIFEMWVVCYWIFDRGLDFYCCGEFFNQIRSSLVANLLKYPEITANLANLFSKEFREYGSFLSNQGCFSLIILILRDYNKIPKRTLYKILHNQINSDIGASPNNIVNSIKLLENANVENNLIRLALYYNSENSESHFLNLSFEEFDANFIETQRIEYCFYEIVGVIANVVTLCTFSSPESENLHINELENVIYKLKDQKKVDRYIEAYKIFMSNPKNLHITNNMSNLIALIDFDNSTFYEDINKIKNGYKNINEAFLYKMVCHLPPLEAISSEYVSIILSIDNKYLKQIFNLLIYIMTNTDVTNDVIVLVSEYIIKTVKYTDLIFDDKTNSPPILYRIQLIYHIYVYVKLNNFRLNKPISEVFMLGIDDIITYYSNYKYRNQLNCLGLLDELLIIIPDQFFTHWMSYLLSEHFFQGFFIIKKRYESCLHRLKGVYSVNNDYAFINFESMVKRIISYEKVAKRKLLGFFNQQSIEKVFLELRKMLNSCI